MAKKTVKKTLKAGEAKKSIKSIKGYDAKEDRFKFSVSPMKQNGYEFYTLSIPSEVLAETCYVTDRYKDPVEGFQRTLNIKKAEQIAHYIDNDGGTIPTSVILSAQPDADVKILTRKTISFKNLKNAFLVIDGQHRIWGYRMAQNSLRVPVVIYKGLDKSQEARLFIDINSKQTPVPSALLLDIRRLAENEDVTEKYLGNLFDLFYSKNTSCLQGRLAKAGGSSKLNRVNFNRAMKQLLKGSLDLKEKTTEEAYEILNQYLRGFMSLKKMNVQAHIHKSNVFYVLMFVFPDIIRKVHSDFGKDYSYESFSSVIMRCFGNSTEICLVANVASLAKLRNYFQKSLDEKLEL